jgi:Domain of unknown function (DUF4286)
MMVYNVTLKLDSSIHEEWLLWMKTIHMPEVMATNCFTECRLLRLLETDESDGPTYAAQYTCSSREEYDKYINEFGPTLRKASIDRWGQKFIAFRSIMELVN